MKISDLLNEDGRIVKGVNTTVDVGPNEISKQAAKFGNKVDKDGHPPTLSKKVKGSSTNVLYNLGISESPSLQRDLLSNPANTVVVNTPGELDWYKIGTAFPTLAKQDPREFGQSESDMVITFANAEEKEKFLAVAKQKGLVVKDIGSSTKHPEIHREKRNIGVKK